MGWGADADDWLPVFPSDWECRFCGQVNTERDHCCVSCRRTREDVEKQ